MTDAERQIIALNPQNPAVAHLQQICGIGPRTASALTACAVDAKYFNSDQQLSAWLDGRLMSTAQAVLVIWAESASAETSMSAGVWPGEDRLNVGLS